MRKSIIHYSLTLTQAQKKFFKIFYELSSILIDLAHIEHAIESEEMEKWYYCSLDIQFIMYDLHMNNSDLNKEITFGLSEKQFASLKTMIALSEKVADWYKNLPDNFRKEFTAKKDFDFEKFSEAFSKINPSIQAINS